MDPTTDNSNIKYDRFYLPGDWSADVLTLPEHEAHHLARVLRKKVGEVVEVFDGHGRSANATVTGITKRAAELKLSGLHLLTARRFPEIILAVAPPKGERFKWLVEKCTELGVDRIVPLRTARSVVDPGEAKRHKLDQTVIAACKQSRRNHLLAISPTTELAELLLDCEHHPILFGDAQGTTAREMFTNDLYPLVASEHRHRLILVVGPEGGFTVEEHRRLLESSALAVAIGPRILRIETAALALATLAVCLR